MFGRKRGRTENTGDDEFEGESDLEVDAADDAAADVAEPRRSGVGPWDAADLPDDGVGRVDLGGLLMPVLEGTELRLDIDQATGALVSASLATATSVMQVLAFAAPRTAGIWADVRTEIVESIRSGGGKADVVDGPYGPEIVADVPAEPGGPTTPSRFIGVDGPRWFLRALVQGQAAVTPSAEPILQQAFGLIGVARGDEAMAVRDNLPLRLPKELSAQPGAPADAPTGDAQPAFTLPERGPINTETR